jgi:hypothetical protein
MRVMLVAWGCPESRDIYFVLCRLTKDLMMPASDPARESVPCAEPKVRRYDGTSVFI